MDQSQWLAERFEENRVHMRGVAYRTLGSLAEADDAVQEAWLRFSRSDARAIENLGGWLTTVVARVCLDMLRSRKSRAEVSLGPRIPDPILTRDDRSNPEHQVAMSDSIGLALLVVLETLAPPERIAFVLHDLFAMPFDEIAPIVGRSSTATRQLASRARRRVEKSTHIADADLARQRKVVDAFVAAARAGDFGALLAVLDPDIALRADRGAPAGASREIRGARAVAQRATFFARPVDVIRPVLVNGTAGIVSWLSDGQPYSVMGFTVKSGKVVEIDVLSDPQRLRHLDLSSFQDFVEECPGWLTDSVAPPCESDALRPPRRHVADQRPDCNENKRNQRQRDRTGTA